MGSKRGRSNQCTVTVISHRNFYALVFRELDGGPYRIVIDLD